MCNLVKRRIISLLFNTVARPQSATVRVCRFWLAVPFLFSTFNSQLSTAFAQGTAFMYQGRLNDNGSPANGNYDLRFTVYDAVTNGSAVSPPLTNSPTSVSNGLFVVNLDFGPGVFTGPARWLDIGVHTNGSATAFTGLSPRQPIVAVPYAIFANSASNLVGTLVATQLTGILPSAQLSGTYSSTVNFNSGANSFRGTFIGDGSSLSNLNASRVTSGTLADARLSPNVPLLNTNQTFTGSNLFTGVNVFSGPANSFNGTFSGNGASLNSLNGSQITGGTVADARLSPNVALLNAIQTFSGTDLFTGPITSTGTNFFAGANNFTNWGNSFVGSFFGNGLVGWIPTNGTAIQADMDHGYLLTSSQFVRVTLPPSPIAGAIVRISGAGAGAWLVQENPGQSIVGNFASYRNSYPVEPAGSGNYHDVAASMDGTRMYLVGNGISGVYASSDSGHTWGQVGLLSAFCQSVACSADGKIVYAVTITGTVEMSSDSGANWSAGGGGYTTISCTADGSRIFTGNIACSGNGTNLATFTSSTISISTNAGASFNVNVPVPSGNLSCLAVSSDCTRLVAGVTNGLLYASANLGATWSPVTSTNQAWSGAWMSGDGSKFAATVSTSGGTTGGVYNYGVNVVPNTVSTNSTISASQGTAVELQFIGNNRWMPVSSTGTIWAY